MNKHKDNKLTTANKLSTPKLNHHPPQSRRSRPLGRTLPTLNGRRFSSSQQPAFTIIEVVLVLAIAGLIFLMVFIALPALQRSRHEEQKRNDMRLLVDAITRSYANTRKYPNDTDELRAVAQEYLDYPGTDVKPKNGETFVDMETGLGYRLWGINGILTPLYLDYLESDNHIHSRLIYYENGHGCPSLERPEQSIAKRGSRIVWAIFRPRKIHCIEF